MKGIAWMKSWMPEMPESSFSATPETAAAQLDTGAIMHTGAAVASMM